MKLRATLPTLLGLLASFFILYSYTLMRPVTTPHRRANLSSSRSSSKIVQVSQTSCFNGPKQNYLFLKTHKTGSSTLQNILARYAYNHDRFIGLPTSGNLFHYMSGTPFNGKFVKPLPPNRKLNALIHHMRFNYPQVKAIIPSDAVYVTIIRNPASQFESVFGYLQTKVKSFQLANSSNPFAEFIVHAKRYFKTTGGMWWFGKNNMFFDLGYQNTNENDIYIKEAIREIDEIFDLVLISDYFDISMLLLKDLMCWKFEDILYLTINARKKSTVEKIDENQAEKIRNWNKADSAVYQYFNSTFWKRVEDYGKERMEKDLKTLAEMNEKLKRKCVDENPVANEKLNDVKYKMFNPHGVKLDHYQLRKEASNNETCLNVILPGNKWITKLFKKQYKSMLFDQHQLRNPKISGKRFSYTVSTFVSKANAAINRS